MRDKLWRQKMKVQQLLSKLSKFSDIWTIDKTHYKFLAHELKMSFKCNESEFLNAIFNASKKDTPALKNLSLRNIFVYSTL